MFFILRQFAGIVTKSMSNRVTNNGIPGKFTCTRVHQDLAATLIDMSGYVLQL